MKQNLNFFVYLDSNLYGREEFQYPTLEEAVQAVGRLGKACVEKIQDDEEPRTVELFIDIADEDEEDADEGGEIIIPMPCLIP